MLDNPALPLYYYLARDYRPTLYSIVRPRSILVMSINLYIDTNTARLEKNSLSQTPANPSAPKHPNPAPLSPHTASPTNEPSLSTANLNHHTSLQTPLDELLVERSGRISSTLRKRQRSATLEDPRRRRSQRSTTLSCIPDVSYLTFY
jgi:hypothetical protein